jgi:TnpA family transposase
VWTRPTIARSVSSRASLLLSRLKSGSPQTPLAAALSEYGRIVRTNFLLRYCADPQLRARIGGQLNKGETLHARLSEAAARSSSS